MYGDTVKAISFCPFKYVDTRILSHKSFIKDLTEADAILDIENIQ